MFPSKQQVFIIFTCPSWKGTYQIDATAFSIFYPSILRPIFTYVSWEAWLLL